MLHLKVAKCFDLGDVTNINKASMPYWVEASVIVPPLQFLQLEQTEFPVLTGLVKDPIVLNFGLVI